MIKIKKNKILILGILLCVFILSIVIVGIKYKHREIRDVHNSTVPIEVANYVSTESDSEESGWTLEKEEILGKNGFKIIIEGTNNVPAKFYPDLLAEYRDKDEDAIKSADKKYAPFFTKEAGVTTINIKNNKTVQFVDKPEKDPTDGYEYYYYMFFIPEIDSHLILCSFFESSNYILINNETGVKRKIWNIPNISPDKNRFAVSVLDPHGDYLHAPAIIEIYEIVSGKYITIFSDSLKCGWDNIRWLSNDSFIADRYGYYGDSSRGHVIFKIADAK